MKAYLVPIIGKGSADDPYRAAVADDGINHAAFIPTDKDGHPLNTQVLILIDEGADWKMAGRLSAEAVPIDRAEIMMETIDSALS